MRRIKMIVLAALAVMAIGAVGAGAANAAPNTGVITVDTGTPPPVSCVFSFTKDNWEPTVSGDPLHVGWKARITSVTEGTPCDANTLTGSGWLYKNSAGAAHFAGTFSLNTTIEVFGIPVPITCTYTGSASAASPTGWAWVPDATDPDRYKAFSNLSGTATRSGGNPLCPSPVNITDLDIDADRL